MDVFVCRLLRKLAPLLTAKFGKALCIMYCWKVSEQSNNVEEAEYVKSFCPL